MVYDSLSSLLEALQDGEIAETEYNSLTNLPTFGGAEPASTEGIYSWDEFRFLIYEDEWEIIDRDDLDAPKELLDRYGLEILANNMDPEIREDVARSFTGASDLDFLLEYMALHLSRHGEDFDETYIP